MSSRHVILRQVIPQGEGDNWVSLSVTDDIRSNYLRDTYRYAAKVGRLKGVGFPNLFSQCQAQLRFFLLLTPTPAKRIDLKLVELLN